MSAEVIQAQYDQLKTIADRFARQAEAQKQSQQRVSKAMNSLQGGWQGKGSAAFFGEMTGKVLPVMERLNVALQQSQRTAIEIQQLVRNAEEEAAKPFKGDKKVLTLAAAVSGTGASPTGSSSTTSVAASSAPTTSGPFKIGPPERPDIKHDNGFLDKFKPHDPTFGDRIDLLKWRAKLEAAEALKPSLADGTAAYRHFLDGNGADRTINYERYLENDANGKATLKNLIIDAQKNAEVLGKDRGEFSMTSRAYQPGGPDARFPYPDTENWQKAIGGHSVWSSADVKVNGAGSDRTYTMTMKVHAEDRYNFNPGQSDIATGIPDSENGVFEITGLARQYTQRGEVTRVITWKEGNIANAEIVDTDTSRNRRPSENRRIRNKI